MEICCLCEKELNDGQAIAVLTEKGTETINRYSETYAQGKVKAVSGTGVHQKCRKDFCRPKKSAASKLTSQEERSSVTRRSTTSTFNSKEHCLFCGVTAKYDGKKKGYDVIPVRTMDFQESIAKCCDERKDKWSEAVLCRLEYLRDLHATDAVYHQACSVNFRTGKQIPKDFSNEEVEPKRARQGRPVDNDRTHAFLKVAAYLKEGEEDGPLTIDDLVRKMEEYLQDSEEVAYSPPYMKSKLIEYFGDEIFLSNFKTQQNVVSLRQTASSIIKDFYNEPKEQDSETETLRIVMTAAKLIKSEIKKMDVDDDVNFPSTEDMSSIERALDFIPDLLRRFLKGILVGKDINLALASIAQAIVQATRPRTILAPLQIGLGVQMHHHFSSRFLVDTLHSHGFCTSYSTVQKYERSAAAAQATDIPRYTPNQFVQFVADNVDHNTRTLDGKGTFHGMGIIATITPGSRICKNVPNRTVKNEDIAKAGRVPIYDYGPPEGAHKLLYKEIKNLKVVDSLKNLDILWKVSEPILKSPRAGWSGTMQTVCQGNHPGLSSILFLPMIDMDPGDESCIYSTLRFISNQAKRYDITPVITFDQPLWWKAMMIVLNEPQDSDIKSIVLRLGGLHIQMSFLGCIGHLMAGSGLQETLELVYAKNAVVHMLSGKAIARAVRGHFLVDDALNALILSETFNVPLTVADGDGDQTSDETQPEEDNVDSSSELLQLAGSLNKQLLDNLITPEEACRANVIERINEKLEEGKRSLANHRTAVLWLQYMNMIDILRRFIKAERIGDWNLHLQAVYDMLPFFAAAGHNLYTKSGYIYLQEMQDLQSSHPDVCTSFQNGLHVIRRSDRLWAGLSTDLAIEQVLMRSVKTTGGLTRGRGMTEIQRLVWLLSMPACAEVNDAMQKVTQVNYLTSEQHKESTKARQERNHKDTQEILSFLYQRNPFSQDPSLRSISTGVVAEANVNADKAKEVGETIVNGLKGKDAIEHSFKKKEQAITLASKVTLKINQTESIQVDPGLLFQRLSIVATGGQYENPLSFFQFEMCSFPPALFDISLLPRKPNKPALADTIWANTNNSQTTSPIGDVYYVLDGGALLHRIPWPPNLTYDKLCSLYVQYVNRRYRRATVVFDGYLGGPSTKDSTHQRRTGTYSPSVNLQRDLLVKLKKDEFLSNPENKQNFVYLLGESLELAGFTVCHDSGDADLAIVQTAIMSSRMETTVLVGDDTDLLILLCFHAELDAHDIFFKPEPKKRSKPTRTWNIKETKSSLGLDVCANLLFVHAILGCDTTSSVYGFGKGTALKKIQTCTEFKEQAKVFNSTGASQNDIIVAGEKALLCLYNSKLDGNLDSLRYVRFCQKVASGTAFVRPESLPPTSAATKYHSLRVYHQVQQWRDIELPAQDWGWKLTDGKLQAVLTDKPPAHPSILELIRCNCKTDCKTKRCTCKKHGLDCSPACGVCQGQSCTNGSHPDIDIDAVDDQ